MSSLILMNDEFRNSGQPCFFYHKAAIPRILVEPVAVVIIVIIFRTIILLRNHVAHKPDWCLFERKSIARKLTQFLVVLLQFVSGMF